MAGLQAPENQLPANTQAKEAVMTAPMTGLLSLTWEMWLQCLSLGFLVSYMGVWRINQQWEHMLSLSLFFFLSL